MRNTRWLQLGLLVLLGPDHDAQADAPTESATAKATKPPARAKQIASHEGETAPAKLLLDDRFRAGSKHAPVALVVYACPRNEACAKLIPELYREVTTGHLKDKAALYYRPFFPSGNDEAAQCGRGLYAAAYQGRFWQYLLHLCLQRDRLSKTTLRDWVAEHGLDRCIFDSTCEQPEAMAWLKAAHDEGVANGVTVAPALFISGRRVDDPRDLLSLRHEVEVELAKMQQPKVVTRKQEEAH